MFGVLLVYLLFYTFATISLVNGLGFFFFKKHYLTTTIINAELLYSLLFDLL